MLIVKCFDNIGDCGMSICDEQKDGAFCWVMERI